MPETTVVPLTPDRWPDLVALFTERAEDGRLSTAHWCWCMFYRLRAKDFAANRIIDNRAALEALASDAAAASRPAPGLVAYRNGRPVGWVSVGPREDYERLRRSKVIPALDDRPVWSVTCFVVSERVRGSGLARPLLDAAIAFARDHGADALEAYPVDTEGERMSPSALWTGTIGTFRALGFRVVGTRLNQQGEPRPERPIVRLVLAAHATGMDK